MRTPYPSASSHRRPSTEPRSPAETSILSASRMMAGGGQGGFIATHDDMSYISEFKDLMFGITNTS